MDLDTLLLHYFGTDDPAGMSEAQLAAGLEKLAIDFGVEREPGRRFALWTRRVAATSEGLAPTCRANRRPRCLAPTPRRSANVSTLP